MNAKFFDVKKEKQDAIINAALKIFAENGYKKASTDVIVKEAGISKGLLFHYFISKQGLYEFVLDYSVRYMSLEMTQSVKTGERDFFEILSQVEQAKTRIMRNYPYMQQFLDRLKNEKDPVICELIGENADVMDQLYNSIYKKADMTKFKDYIDVVKVIKMINWMSEGFVKEHFRQQEIDIDEMNVEFEKYIKMIKTHFYRDGLEKAQEEALHRTEDAILDSKTGNEISVDEYGAKSMTLDNGLGYTQQYIVARSRSEIEKEQMEREEERSEAEKEKAQNAEALTPQEEHSETEKAETTETNNSGEEYMETLDMTEVEHIIEEQPYLINNNYIHRATVEI